MSSEDVDNILSDFAESIFPIAGVLPEVDSAVVCTRQGGTYRYSIDAKDWLCFTDNKEDNSVDPPLEEPDDDPEEKRRPTPIPPQDRSDTDEEKEDDRPDPDPLPTPDPPPVKNDDDDGDRKPNPKPVPEGDEVVRLPKIPSRRLPVNRPVGEGLVIFQKPSIEVKLDAFSRIYGCLLHSPITSSPIPIRLCKTDETINEADEKEGAKKFFEYLIRKVAETGAEEIAVLGCVAALNILPTRLIRYSPNGQLAFVFGCNFLTNVASDFLFSSSNAYQAIDGNGHINLKYVDCSPSEDDDGIPDLTDGLTPKDNSKANECFVPIRNFKQNEPEQAGMKRQLQIIFTRTEDILDNLGQPSGKTRNIDKQISIPAPLPLDNEFGGQSLDMDLLKANVPETWEFGTVKVEVDIVPYGFIRFYALEEDTIDSTFGGSKADELIDDFLNLVDGSEKFNTSSSGNTVSTRRFSKRNRNIITGKFTRKKAFLFEWNDGDGKPPLCSTFTF